MTLALHGVSASKGIAIGRVFIVERGQVEVVERSVGAELVEAEVARLRKALRAARAQLRAIRKRIPDAVAGEVAPFIDTHLLMLDDVALVKASVALIRERGCNAEWALKLQRDALVAVFDAMEDSYLRSRREDVDHVVSRVQRALLRADDVPEDEVPRLTGRVIVADDLTPADTVLMQHQGVAAFVTEFGGPNSHAAILARSLRIPAVAGVHAARTWLSDEEELIVDGREGVVLAGFDSALRRHFERRQREIARHHAARRKLRGAPAVSADGEAVGLQANVELPTDVDAVASVGAAGVGLYRTEYMFMNRTELPDEGEQYADYSRMVARLRGAPVTIRTLDLGADKQVDGTRPGAPAFSNPALGLRAVRLCLREQGLFRPQLRAILRASVHGPVRMMIPMLSNVQELEQVVQVLDECRRELSAAGIAFDPRMPIGAMIEVPAAAVCADLFARRLDFLSIGTNDLIQYTIAIDRVDDEVSYLYDPLNPAVLRLVLNTIRAGQRARIPVAMCGEMAGDARYTRLLLGMGLKEFSVPPNSLLEVKQIVLNSHIGRLRKHTQRFMRATLPATRTRLLREMSELDGGPPAAAPRRPPRRRRVGN